MSCCLSVNGRNLQPCDWLLESCSTLALAFLLLNPQNICQIIIAIIATFNALISPSVCLSIHLSVGPFVFRSVRQSKLCVCVVCVLVCVYNITPTTLLNFLFFFFLFVFFSFLLPFLIFFCSLFSSFLFFFRLCPRAPSLGLQGPLTQSGLSYPSCDPADKIGVRIEHGSHQRRDCCCCFCCRCC